MFTCALVRAVHFELVDSLSLEDVMLALRRFAARKRLLPVMYSDNAKTFKGAQVQRLKYFGYLSPQWKFIAHRSPWWDEWWEQLVRSGTSALQKLLGAHSLTRKELETTLHEIEACINSHSLIFIGDDLDSENSFIPSHFLIGRATGFQIIGSVDPIPTNIDLLIREEIRQQLMDKFWSIWTSQYICNLPP